MEDVWLALETANSAWEAVCSILNLKETVHLKVIHGLWHWWLQHNRIREGAKGGRWRSWLTLLASVQRSFLLRTRC